jgi:succinate-semialdehyde dehydrogenase/glutarate-semialdehyde dehydrogenase
MNLNDLQLLKSLAYVDGAWCGADGGATFPVTNPAGGALLAVVPDMGVAETRRAIAAADAAWPAWRGKTAKERAAILRKWFELMLAHADDLALLMTSEQGKPLAEAKGEVAYAASFVEWFAEEAKRVYGDTIPATQADKRLIVVKQPIGVCAAITPWNFPAAMITRKVAPALAAGCTVVVKPAEQTPLSALALAELAHRAGFPPGVFNVVTGAAASAPKIGGELTGNPTVRKLSFTGSTEVGRLLMAQCAPTVKKVSFELGGNAPLIVFDDADLDAAVEGALASKYRNTGQTCVCANRLLVQDGIYDAFAARLAEAAKKMKVGAGTEAGVLQGPLIDEQALAKVEEHVADALAKGAKVLTGGRRHALGGTFYEPTVIADVTPDMKCAREETFGPVAPLFRFRTEAEAVALANDTEFGLAAYFFSRDVARCFRVGEALEYGMVGVNTGIMSNEVAPFGGVKQSGIGREGSKYGIEDYLEIKYLCFGGIA